MLNYINKDLTTVTGNVIIMHGVNCQDVMGSGVAKALYTKWPQVKRMYHTLGKVGMHLGMVQVVSVADDPWIFNCFTQEYYGRSRGVVYASSEAVREVLLKSCAYAIDMDITDIYLPRIGCGLGGLDWEKDVLPHLLECTALYPNINITVCDHN